MKTSFPWFSKILVLSGLCMSCASALAANIISLNIIANPATDAQNIDADETFGVGTVYGQNTVAGNWTNTAASSLSSLIWSNGTASTVGYIGTQPNGTAGFNALYGDTPLLVGFDDYTTTVNPVTIGFTNLQANFSAGYFAIVYLTGFNTVTGASVSDGTTTYYYQTLNPPVAPITLVQTTTTTDLGDGNAPFAQYAVFGSDTTPLTADSITFTLDTLYGGGSGIGGVQLVAVPEPATFALLAALAAFGLIAYRRRH